MKRLISYLLCLLSLCQIALIAHEAVPTLHICTVATHQTKQVDQLLDSCKQKALVIDILGLDSPFRGRADKLLYVQRYVHNLPDSDVVLFVDGYDTLVLADKTVILDKFFSMKAPFVIAAEKTCWPDRDLAQKYPQSPTSYKYLNSGSYIGYVKEVKEILSELVLIQAGDDDQALFTTHFLLHPGKYMLDTSCKLFLPTLNVTKKELLLDVERKRVTCLETKSNPCVIHGNGRSPWYQHIYEHFFAKAPSDKRSVFLAVIVKENENIPALKQTLQAIEQLDYNKKNITLHVSAASAHEEIKKVLVPWAEAQVSKYHKVIQECEALESGVVKAPFKALGELRNKSFQRAKEEGCEYYFVVGSDDLLAPCTLKELVSKDKPIVAPMLKAMPELHDCFSNYYFAVTESGYYKDHPDYFRILNREIVGTFKVPLVYGTYLVQSKYLDALSAVDDSNDYDFIVFSRSFKKQGIDQYICTEKDFGEMVHFHSNLSHEEKDAKLKECFALSATSADLSETDLEYIKTFPTSQYEVFHAKGQGLFYLDAVNDVIKNELKAGRLWEPAIDKVIQRYVKTNTIALDVGAHIGTHTVTMSRAVGKGGGVFAFEPQRKIFRELFLNLKMNGCENVKPLHLALGAENRYIYLDDPVANNEGSRFIAYGAGSEKVVLKTLDSFHLDNISFIKVDVENYEEAFLDGAKETIARCKPVMLIEILGNCVLTPRYGYDYKKIKTKETIAKLERLGYTVTNFGGDDYLAIPKIP